VNAPKPYLNPYLTGIGIGLVLLLAFVLVGRGIGATGAYSTLVAASVDTIAPQHTSDSLPYQAFLNQNQESSLKDWLVIEIVGVFIGGLLSALWSQRFRFGIERGPTTASNTRLLYALGGGVLMGLGAKLARGCTSSQGLTGGAMFSLGAWLFIIAAFFAAYMLAPWVKKQWT
jgi:hypothetical protein